MIPLGMVRAHVLRWNGKDIPEQLRELPAGTYVVEAVDEPRSVTSEEEQGLLRHWSHCARSTAEQSIKFVRRSLPFF